MAESARRIRARPRAVVGVWCRPDYGDCRRQHALAGRRAPSSCACCCFCWLVWRSCLSTPAALQLYRYPFDTLRSSGMRSFIGEWHSPDFHEWLYRPFLLVWLLLLTALASSRSRPKGRVIVPLLLTSFAALDAVRHIPIFILLAMPVIAAALPAARGEREKLHPSASLRQALGKRETWGTHLFAVPATFQRGGCHSDGCVCIGEVGQSCPQPGRSRGGAVSPKARRVLAGRRPSPEEFLFTMTGEAMRSGSFIPNIAYLWTAARTSMATISCGQFKTAVAAPHRLARRS